MKLIDAFREREYTPHDWQAADFDAWRDIRRHNRRARFLQGLLWFLLMAAGMLAAFWPQAKTEAPSHKSNQEPNMPKQNNNPRAALGWTSFESTRVLFAHKVGGERSKRSAALASTEGPVALQSFSGKIIERRGSCHLPAALTNPKPAKEVPIMADAQPMTTRNGVQVPTVEALKRMDFRDIVKLSEEQLRELASWNKTKQLVLKILDRRSLDSRNKQTWMEASLHPNDSFKNRRKCRRSAYEKYLTSSHWRHFRRAAINNAEGKCQRCGTDRCLQVHHEHYNTLGKETFDDVRVLCEACHAFEHGQRPPDKLRRH